MLFFLLNYSVPLLKEGVEWVTSSFLTLRRERAPPGLSVPSRNEKICEGGKVNFSRLFSQEIPTIRDKMFALQKDEVPSWCTTTNEYGQGMQHRRVEISRFYFLTMFHGDFRDCKYMASKLD